jgi:hypothetical protein
MFLDYTRAGIAKILRHNDERHSVHNSMTGRGVAQSMEIDRRVGSPPGLEAGVQLAVSL